MADERQFGELAEISPSGHYGGRWSRQPPATSPHHPHHQHHQRFSAASTPRAAGGSREAEDACGLGRTPRRSGAYYSPPGTSYTIVERPCDATPGPHRRKPPRGTYLGSSASFGADSRKRPISPEQVLRLLSDGRLPTPHHPGPAGSPSSAHLQARELPPNLHQDLLVRTVTMTRPPDSGHGFGICVKGGKDSGVGVYISRVEEGSIAERVGLRPGDTILEVNGTPFSGISHEEALKMRAICPARDKYLKLCSRAADPLVCQQMLKSCRQLSMTVKSPNLPPPPPPPPPPMERPQPASPWLVRQAYSWIDRQGRPVSPPPEYARASPPPPPPPNPRYYCRPGKDKGVRKVELNIEPGQSLGLMIRGGVEYNLGIFITGVDKDSVADRAGLMIGDQILEVNGQSFLEVTHDEAVNQLKFHKRMALLVRDVGKVPHSCTAYDDLPWEAHSPGRGARQQRSPALQMVEEKARVVLSKGEFATLAYYQEEYATGQMTVEAFLAVLLELLHTPEKYTLLTEIRELVAPEDRARFDELVYRREAEGQRCRELRDLLGQREQERHQHPAPRRKGGIQGPESNHALLMSNLHDLPGPPASASAAATAARPCDLPQGGLSCDPYREPEEFRTPSEDSGVCLGPEPPAPARCARAGGGVAADWPSSPASSHLDKRTSDLALSNDEDLDSCHQEYGGGGGGGGGGRRHSSPGGSRRASGAGLDASAYAADANMELAHKLSRSFDMKEDQELLGGESSVRRHHSMQRLARGETADSSVDQETGALIVPDQQGNLRITVKKTKPILGIAIEGGADTKHPLPRIINIHENGAAFEAGGLEVGQLILEVDGQRVEGLQHQDVARLIAESFARRERQDIEFLVVEAKKSNLEPKPTALIFLEA